MGNINCCKKPDEKIESDLINDPEDINQLDTDGYPQDSVKKGDEQNNQNEEEIKPLPNNEEIEANSNENNQKENEEPEQKEEEDQKDEEEQKEEEEPKEEQEQKEENVEDAAKKSYEQEANAAVSHSQNQIAEEENDNQEQDEDNNEENQEQPEDREQQPPVEVHMPEAEPQPKEEEPQEKQEVHNEEEKENQNHELEQEKTAEREIIEQQLNQNENMINTEKEYNDIVGQTVDDTTYIKNLNQNIPEINNNMVNIEQATTNTYATANPQVNQTPIILKNEDELNKYFESIGVNVNSYNQEDSSTPNTYNYDASNININNNDEDLNKYFQPNAYTQNGNIDLASLGLQTSTTVQGATSADEINKYFQNTDNAYTTNDIDLTQYGIGTTNAASSSYTKNAYNTNNQYNEYSKSQVTQNNVITTTTNTTTNYVPQSYNYSYSYNYNTPTINNY